MRPYKHPVVANTPIGRILIRGMDAPGGMSEARQDLWSDVTASFHRIAPRMAASIPPSRAVNAKLIQFMHEELAKSPSNTAGNLAASAAAASVYMSYLEKFGPIKEALDEQDKASDQAEKMLRKYMEGEGELTEEELEALQEQMKDAQARAEAAADRVEEITKSELGSRMVSEIVSSARAEGEQVEGFVSALGCGDEASSLASSPEEANKILRVMSRIDVQEFAEILGRAEGAVANRMMETQKVADIELTRRVERLFPYQRASISHIAPPPLRAHAMARFLSSGLVGWTPSEDEERKGPFRLLLDESGSMSGIITLAKALAVALVKMASNQGREWQLIAFSDWRDEPRIVTSKDGTVALMEWIAKFMYGGGTSFDRALQAGFDNIDEELGDTADVGMITDGYSSISEETAAMVNRYKENGARLISCIIGGGGGYYYGRAGGESLETLSDELIRIEKGDRDELITRMVRAMVV